jgi:NhaP-type Na+/H+ or K+/H+ antiporter
MGDKSKMLVFGVLFIALNAAMFQYDSFYPSFLVLFAICAPIGFAFGWYLGRVTKGSDR